MDKAFVEKISNKLEGFGVLIPRELDCVEFNDDNSLLGIIYYSSVFPLFDEEESDNDAMSLVFMFGGPQFDVHCMSREHVVEIVKRKLLQMYDVNIDEEYETMIVCDMETDDPMAVFAVDNEEFVQADVVF